LYLFTSMEKGWSQQVRAGRQGANEGVGTETRTSSPTLPPLPMISRGGTNNGAWFHSRHLWVQNEDTPLLNRTALVDGRSFNDLLANVEPTARSPEASLHSGQPRPGFEIELVAAEPLGQSPCAFAGGPDGKLWVVEMGDYPLGEDGKGKPGGRIKYLEDTNGDGKYVKATLFLDGLSFPTGVMPWGRGVIVTCAPEIFYAEDTDGDGKADVRRRVLHGLDSADTHHTANSFALDPGGALYFQEGTFHHTQVETAYGPPVRCVNAGVYRYEPRAQKFDAYVTYGFANPHGHVWDRWGQDFVYDGTGANPYHGALFSGHLDFPSKHARPPQVYQQRTRPCPGVEILSSRHFPDELQGNYLVANVIGFQGILQYKIEDQGASFGGTEAEPILFSSDPNFRPSDVKVGPDGAIYFIDWQNPIIGHMQHNHRDPSRDRVHGRIYRVTAEGRPPLLAPKIAGVPVNRLLDLLRSPEDRVRYRVRPELAHKLRFENTAQIREDIARAIPSYALIATLAREGDQFQYGGPHLCWGWSFPTPDGKAHFSVVEPPETEIPDGKFIVATRRGKRCPE